MNGGKDVRLGDDKRPVSIIPLDEQPLFNIANGIRLTDEFGNPLVTKIDQIFIADTSSTRATSIVFPKNPKDKYNLRTTSLIAETAVTYGNVLHVATVVGDDGGKFIPVLQVGSATPVRAVGTVLPVGGAAISLDGFPNVHEVGIVNPISGSPKYLHFTTENKDVIDTLKLGDLVFGFNISTGSVISSIKKNQQKISITGSIKPEIVTENVKFIRTNNIIYEADNVLKVAEVFPETSEVSSTLLGVPRAEVQLSLFSNVSSYGIEKNDWEEYQYNGGNSKRNWEERVNAIYGEKYMAKIEEETQESAIKLSAFPVSFSFPYGPLYKKIGVYNPEFFPQYLRFIQLGNAAYKYFSRTDNSYSASFAQKFLNESDVRVENEDVVYSKVPGEIEDFREAFAKIDIWTETWRSLQSKLLLNPVTQQNMGLGDLVELLTSQGVADVPREDTRPGYRNDLYRYSAIQSRRVFRYQPGRISGFTFGLRCASEITGGIALEWGIANATDQYLFNVYANRLSIIRRSTVPLSNDVLIRNGLDPTKVSDVRINGEDFFGTVQPRVASGDPFDVTDGAGPFANKRERDERARKYYTVRIDRDDFNGDPLNGNGPSGYTVEVDKVTMWKIEFGWYGAIGARFYAYIPSGTGEARWVTLHTLVIENQLGEPCLRDSYFRFKYALNSVNNNSIYSPQFVYKYGASYYIDGGDEGTTQIYSVDTGQKPKTVTNNERTIFGLRPRDNFVSSTARALSADTEIDDDGNIEIANRRLILPTKISLSSDILSEVKVRTCTGCQGHGHVYTPGVINTYNSTNAMLSREVELRFTGDPDNNTIEIWPNTVTDPSSATPETPYVGVTSYFTEDDIGSKLVAPSIFNAYITSLTDTNIDPVNGKKYYKFAKVHGWGPGFDGYPNYNLSTDDETGGRSIGGARVIDYGASGINGNVETEIPVGAATIYPHKVRLSSYHDVHFASDQELTGSEIKIQFINPDQRDGISSYRSNTHWADCMIGVTNKKPTVGGLGLVGWSDSVVPWKDYTTEGAISGSGTTTILPNSNILFGEHTHTHGGMNVDGLEESEKWAPTDFRVRMGEDVRIPKIASPSGGRCSSITIKVSEKLDLGTNLIFVTISGDKDPNGNDVEDGDGDNYFLIAEKDVGTFSNAINDWTGGQVVIADSDGEPKDITLNVFFKQRNHEEITLATSDYRGGRFIRISGPLSETTNIKILGKIVTLEGNRLGPISPTKIFTYAVYPLYLVGKLRDNSRINNIVIREKNGSFTKTTSPKLYISQNSNGSIDTVNTVVDGVLIQALNDSTPPPNFEPIDSLSSALVDSQNLRPVRQSVIRDTFYVGENQTKEVDLSKTFGVDRNVITPDNTNTEVTFVTVKEVSTSKNSGSIQGSLNFKEQ